MPKVGFVSLGCPKALVDSEQILSRLKALGYETSPSYEEAELVIVNTCGFITPAVEESLEAIGEALRENGRVVVTGCLGARAEVIQERHPEVLAVTGPGEVDRVLEAVQAILPPVRDPFLDPIPPQVRLTPRHYAYLKLSEGCDHRCSFCIIPRLRGPLHSRDAAEILAEAARLVATGAKELILVSQDTSAYGVDLKHRESLWGDRPVKAHLVDLLQAMSELGAWIRLHYIYPYARTVEALLPLMAEGRVLPYLDIPFQHASPRILKLMRRPGGPEVYLDQIRAWRKAVPGLAIRSTFIVGFPGETEEDFALLLDFLKEARLDRVGVFTYSPVEGAEANRLPGHLPEPVKEERKTRLMELQAQISQEIQEGLVGRVLEVLVDEVPEPALAVGRSYRDAPGIDGLVYVETDGTVRPGEWVRVRVERAEAYDLYGVLV